MPRVGMFLAVMVGLVLLRGVCTLHPQIGCGLQSSVPYILVDDAHTPHGFGSPKLVVNLDKAIVSLLPHPSRLELALLDETIGLLDGPNALSTTRVHLPHASPPQVVAYMFLSF